MIQSFPSVCPHARSGQPLNPFEPDLEEWFPTVLATPLFSFISKQPFTLGHKYRWLTDSIPLLFFFSVPAEGFTEPKSSVLENQVTKIKYFCCPFLHICVCANKESIVGPRHIQPIPLSAC